MKGDNSEYILEYFHQADQENVVSNLLLRLKISDYRSRTLHGLAGLAANYSRSSLPGVMAE